MKLKTLDGYEYNIQLKSKPRQNSSQYHTEAIKLIKETWPTIIIIEELSIKIQSGLTLYLDLYLPIFRKSFEIMGQQHYLYNNLFHESKLDLYRQQKLDQLKLDFCQLNDIELIYLKYNEQNTWGNLICGH